MQLQGVLAALLPEAGLRGIHGLVSLKVSIGISYLPPHLPASLPALSSLDLSGNLLSDIQPSLAELKNLKILVLLSNPTLQLTGLSVKTLKMLPQLSRLDIRKGSRNEGHWSLESFEAILAIEAAMPDLKLELSY
jgi:Leucine-rich repeat (LRR) protein